MNGRSLGLASAAMVHTSLVISNENPTSFAVESKVIFLPSFILGGNTSKGEVNERP